MIKEGTFTVNNMLLWGFVDRATQEEADRLGRGQKAGLIIFIPLAGGATQPEIDMIAKSNKTKEEQ